jgi:hypothetical protein
VIITGMTATTWLDGRQISHVRVFLPFLASYKIGEGRTRWTCRPSKAFQRAYEALDAAFDGGCHE